MGLDALLLGGMPPNGRGLYVRDRIEPGFDFYVVNAWRGDRARLVAEARARGAQVWMFGGLEHWRPSNALANVEYCASEARRLGAVGIVADPEDQWGGEDATLRALAARLRAISSGMRVGVTSYPFFAGLQILASTVGPNVWFSPQIYGRTSQDPQALADMWRRATNAFGRRTIPSIAAWPSSPLLRTGAGYAQYLAMLPRDAGGFIAWDDGAGIEPWRLQMLLAHHVGGNALSTTGNQALAFLLRPAGLTIVLGILAVVIATAILWKAK